MQSLPLEVVGRQTRNSRVLREGFNDFGIQKAWGYEIVDISEGKEGLSMEAVCGWVWIISGMVH